MMLKQSREDFLHALSGCIEHAPAEQQRELFDSFRRFRQSRGERQWRTMKRLPTLAHLLATIEDALLPVEVQRTKTRVNRGQHANPAAMRPRPNTTVRSGHNRLWRE